MSSDFEKGTRNDSSNVSNWSEFHRGEAYQRAANVGQTWGTPHSTSAPIFSGTGPNVNGNNPVMQGIVSIPFIVVGALLYPITAAVTVAAAAICARLLLPLFGYTAGWVRLLAYLPMLAVFWVSMRWDQRLGERNVGYRRIRHTARLLVFAIAGFAIAGRFWPSNGGSNSQLFTMPHLVGAGVGLALGHLFLTRAEGWRDFWHRTLSNFRLRPAR